MRGVGVRGRQVGRRRVGSRLRRPRPAPGRTTGRATARRRSISVTSRRVTPRSRATAAVSSAVSQPRLLLVLAQVEEQLALRLGRGDLHQPPVAQHVLVDLGADPVHGERHQPHADRRVEALDRLHQADVAFLDQVAHRQAVADVAARDVHHEAQVRQHELPRRVEVARRGGSGWRVPTRPRGSAPGCGSTASTYASKLPIGPARASSAGLRGTRAVVVIVFEVLSQIGEPANISSRAIRVLNTREVHS